MSNRRVASLLSFALVAGGSLAAWAQKPACTTGTIQTSSGPVCGSTSTAAITGAGSFTTAAYLGIPYAVPPAGPLRWQYSTLFKGSAPLVAAAYGNACPQTTVASTASTASGSRCTNGKVLGAGESEDCLYLNVWVPGGTTARGRNRSGSMLSPAPGARASSRRPSWRATPSACRTRTPPTPRR